MKIDLGKLAGWLVLALAIVIILFGLCLYVFMTTVQQQSLGIQTATFGLLFLWFELWRRQNRPKRGR